jgi:hypothetical protein
MNRQKIVALFFAFLSTCAVASCNGGGGQPQSGFKTMGRKWVQVVGGGFRFVSPTSIRGQWLHDNGNAVGNVTSFGPLLCGGPCPVANARVPARWNIVAGLPGGAECIGYLSNNDRNVTANSTQYSDCVTFGIVFPLHMSPASIDLQAPPATFHISGKRLNATNGLPFIEYVDEYTGRVIGSTTATSVSLDGSSIEANMPNLSLVFSGTYSVLVSNIRPDGGREYIGTTTVECYGRDGGYEDPPDPGPCGCPSNSMACLPCDLPQY